MASRHMRGFTVLLLIAASGCSPARPRQEANPLERVPVDSARVGSASLPAAWKYHEELRADLDGDGSEEAVVLAADVELDMRGNPLWEDGHRWALYVESESGKRTLLYAAFVPNGRATAALLRADDRGRRLVMIEERAASQLVLYEVEYESPGKARLSTAFYSQVERWLSPPPR